MGTIVYNLLLVLALVLLNGCFVAAEFALVKVRGSRLTQLVNEGNVRAKHAFEVNRRLDTYLSATQLGITLASLGLGWAGEPAVSRLIVEPLMRLAGIGNPAVVAGVSFVVAFITITFLHITLGELAPKSLAIQKSEQTSLLLSGPLMLFYRIFKPAIVLLNGAAAGILRMAGIAPVSEYEAAHTEEEIRLLMDQSMKSGYIDQDERKLFDNVFEFSDRLAREVMLPRTDMDCLYLDAPYRESLGQVYATKHTRYPVARKDKDEIVGFVHITDLLTADPDEVHDLADFLRPITSVPESMEVSKVLKLMQKRHSQLAVVVDEYGGTAGLLTAEDILEEIVGEIHDEFDDERPEVEEAGDAVSVDGRLLLEEINERFDLQIEDDEVDTIGGWLFKKLEGHPQPGDTVDAGNCWFEVEEIVRLRVTRVRIRPNPSLPETERPNGDKTL